MWGQVGEGARELGGCKACTQARRWQHRALPTALPRAPGPRHRVRPPSLGARVSAPALVQPSPTSLLRVHSPLAQAVLAQCCLLVPLITAPIVTRPLCCHRCQSASQARPCLASPHRVSPLPFCSIYLSSPFSVSFFLPPFCCPFFFSSCLFVLLFQSISLFPSFSSLFLLCCAPLPPFLLSLLIFSCGEPTPDQGPDMSCGS